MSRNRNRHSRTTPRNWKKFPELWQKIENFKNYAKKLKQISKA